MQQYEFDDANENVSKLIKVTMPAFNEQEVIRYNHDICCLILQ